MTTNIADAIRAKLLADPELAKLVDIESRIADAVQEVCDSFPAWHDRPTCPGWWACILYSEQTTLLKYELKDLHGPIGHWKYYGPIPNPPSGVGTSEDVPTI